MLCHVPGKVLGKQEMKYISFESKEFIIEGRDTSQEENTKINTKIGICTEPSGSKRRKKISMMVENLDF